MALSISGPAENPSFDKNAHLGHLIIFVNIVEVSGSTAFGDDTWAQCELVADLDDEKYLRDVKVFGTALAPAVYQPGEPMVCGRLTQGTTSKPGQSPPWLLETPTEDDLVVAQKFVDTYVTELPSGKPAIDFDGLDLS